MKNRLLIILVFMVLFSGMTHISTADAECPADNAECPGSSTNSKGAKTWASDKRFSQLGGQTGATRSPTTAELAAARARREAAKRAYAACVKRYQAALKGLDNGLATGCKPELDESFADARPVPPSARDLWVEFTRYQSKYVVFPALTVQVRPRPRTFINFHTAVWAKSAVYTRTVTVLGWPVTITATPVAYTWNFGDATTLTTRNPGRFPDPNIIHLYQKRIPRAKLTVTTGYTARARVAGYGWQTLPGQVNIAGPPTYLRVQELVPTLVKPPR